MYLNQTFSPKRGPSLLCFGRFALGLLFSAGLQAGGPPPPQFGDPLPDLTADQTAAFTDGLDDFVQIESAPTGLGPIFNNVSCAACHSAPAAGGASGIFVTRFGRLVNGRFDPLKEKGGSLLQQSAIDPAVQENIPPEANVIAHRQTTPLFGAGLIEAIPDRTILLNALRSKPDGIQGRASIVKDAGTGRLRVGHFGWKGQHAKLLAFAGDAYLNEMGITNRLFPHENAPNGNAALLPNFDLLNDPEDEVEGGKGDIDRAADFMRFLAPPPPVPLTESAQAGKRLFQQIGCATCHQPVMFTGWHRVAAFNRKAVPLFSDLLLHNMGPLGDGIGQGRAHPQEMKTPPLWGLRASGPYLHDGRAATVDEAIRAHEGEGRIPKNRYLKLDPVERQQLLDFLNSI